MFVFDKEDRFELGQLKNDNYTEDQYLEQDSYVYDYSVQ